MKFEKKIDAAKAMPDSDLKLSKLETLALQAIPHSSTQKALQVEIKRLYKAGYKIRIPEKYQPKASASNEKYEVHIVGSKSDPVIYDNKAQAEKAKRDNELFGFETTIKKVEPKKETSKMAEKKKKDDKNQKKEEQKYIHLQWIGKTRAVKASELKPGDVTVWNGGATAKVANVEVSKSGKTVMIEYIDPHGKRVKDTRKFRADRLIGIDKAASKPLIEPNKADKPAPKVTPAQPKKTADKPTVKRSASKPAAPKNEPTVAKKAASAKKSAADKLLMHSDKDEMSPAGEMPIVINAKNAKPKRAPKVLRRVVKTGGYTAWDDIKKSGKTFGTEKEARDYAADVLKKTGKVVPVSFTNKQVTHTFKPEEEKKKK